MPKLTMETHNLGGNFNFQGTRIDSLGATEYTLVTIAVDVTGSTKMFSNELHAAMLTAIESCKSSPRSDNLLLRVVTFSTYVGGVQELHGFKPLAEVQPNDYPVFDPDGLTPLYDAAYSAIGSMVAYGKDLMDNDYLANGIAFVITDGYDNASKTTPKMVKDQISKVTQEEALESLITVLIGINAKDYQRELDNFKQEAGIDSYLDAGDATKGKLAKLADFVSQSISSQSQSLGTGGASQNISATI